LYSVSVINASQHEGHEQMIAWPLPENDELGEVELFKLVDCEPSEFKDAEYWEDGDVLGVLGHWCIARLVCKDCKKGPANLGKAGLRLSRISSGKGFRMQQAKRRPAVQPKRGTQDPPQTRGKGGLDPLLTTVP
jgi:hypothetical protein